MFSIYIYLCNFTAAHVLLFLVISFFFATVTQKQFISEMGLESKSCVIETSKLDATKRPKMFRVTQLFPLSSLITAPSY